MKRNFKSVIGTFAVLLSIQPVASWALNEAPASEKSSKESRSESRSDKGQADKIIVEKATKSGDSGSKRGAETNRNGPDCPDAW